MKIIALFDKAITWLQTKRVKRIDNLISLATKEHDTLVATATKLEAKIEELEGLK